MAYATSDDVVSRYRPILSMIGAGSYEVVSLDVTSIFVADAESFVDAYLGSKYAVPISPVPSLITQITSDLSIFNMLTEKQVQVPDFMQARYDRNINVLEMLRDGSMVLPSSVALLTTGDQEVWSNNEEYHSIFSPVLDELEQKADADWIDAAIDERAND
jgi:phage gp36-like protein